ncbi:hypothetical protein [uncultured Faecalibaculum sp.]|uniref:hypothetical protein n=1 Tax=uncultured Faecalibaculum sp. TaxID=1729681 RepID=UPI0026095DF2|nr:hypothetical protein [uncultured Faecalibaculum sp.]
MTETNRNTTWQRLDAALQDIPGGGQILQEMRTVYGPDMTPEQGIYWLSESGFSTAAWQKKHLELGETQKAAKEETRLQAINAALDSLQNS